MSPAPFDFPMAKGRALVRKQPPQIHHCECQLISRERFSLSILLAACCALGCSTVASTISLPFLTDCGDANASITALAFSNSISYLYVGASATGGPEGNRVSSDDVRSKIIAWDLARGSKQSEYETSLWPAAIAVTPNDKQLIVGYGRCVFDGPSDILTSVCRHSDVGCVVALNPRSLEEQHRIDLPWSVYSISISPDGQLLAIQGANRKGEIYVHCYRLEDWKEIGVFSFEGTAAGIGSFPVQTLQFSPDNRWLIAATVSRGKRNIEDADEEAIRFSRGEIVSEEHEQVRRGRLAIIDLEKLAVAKILTIVEGPVSFLNLSANGKRLAFTGGEGCYLADLDLSREVLVNILNVHGRGVACFAGNSQSNLWRFTTSSHPGGTGYWCGDRKDMATTTGNSASGVVLGRNKECNWAQVTAVAVSNDGESVATGDRGGSIFVWRPEPSEGQ